MALMNEILNSFVLEFRQDLSNYDINKFKENSKYALEGVADSLILDNVSPDKYCEYLDKVIINLRELSDNTQQLLEFYNSIYNSVYLNDKSITIPVRPMEDITKIRPEYLANMPIEFDMRTKEIMAGKYSINKISSDYATGAYLDKIKKQLVRTSIVQNSPKDLMVMDSPTIIRVDENYITTVIIPFLKSYNQNVKDLMNITVSTKGKINQAERDFRASFSALSNMKYDTKIGYAVNYLKYSMYRSFLSVCAYITSMIIRKGAYYSYNMMAYTNLYNTFYNYFPDGTKVLHESVIDGNLYDIDDGELVNSMIENKMNVILPYMQRTIGKVKMEIAKILSMRYNTNISFFNDESMEQYQYDTRPYIILNKTIIDILKRIESFKNAMISNKNLVVDELLNSTGMDINPADHFSNELASVLNTDYYTNLLNTEVDDHGQVVMSIYTDICHFDDNCEVISTNINKAYYALKSIEEYLEVNQGYDDATHRELQSVVNSAIGSFKDYALEVSKKLIDRLNNLSDILDDFDLSENETLDQFVPIDYSEMVRDEEYNDIEMKEKACFESLLTDYHIKKTFKETGVKIILEAETPTPAADTNGNGKPDPKPEVKTDAQQQTPKTGETVTNQNNAQNLGAVDRFLRFIQSILDSFRKTSERLIGKNDQWLKANKEAILNLNTDNTMITVAKYDGVTEENLTNVVNTATSAINALSSASTRARTETNLFKTIPAKVGTENKLGARVKQFYIYGPNGTTNLISYSGGDAKNQIQSMINFCENYGKFYKNFSSKLEALSKAAADKQKQLMGQQSTTQTTPSNTNQNPQPTQEAADDKEAATHVTNAVREFSGAILTVVEKKYLDYMKILKKLVPGQAKPAENKPEEQQAENNNNQETK